MNQATSNRWLLDAAWSPPVRAKLRRLRTVDWSRAAGVVGLVGFVVAWYLVAALLATPSLLPFPHIVIDRALSWFIASGASSVSVVTQGANAGAHRIYQRAGFTLEEISHFYHFWIKQT